jgi:hypothetical protein
MLDSDTADGAEATVKTLPKQDGHRDGLQRPG